MYVVLADANTGLGPKTLGLQVTRMMMTDKLGEADRFEDYHSAREAAVEYMLKLVHLEQWDEPETDIIFSMRIEEEA